MHSEHILLWFPLVRSIVLQCSRLLTRKAASDMGPASYIVFGTRPRRVKRERIVLSELITPAGLTQREMQSQIVETEEGEPGHDSDQSTVSQCLL